jgi:hypothetical protein
VTEKDLRRRRIEVHHFRPESDEKQEKSKKSSLPSEMLALWNSALPTHFGGFHRAGLFPRG